MPLRFIVTSIGIGLAVIGLVVVARGIQSAYPPDPVRLVGKTVDASVSAECHVGSVARSLNKAIRGFKSLHLEKAPVIAGCGRRAGEELDVIVYVASGSICAVVERPRIGSVQGGECKPRSDRWTDWCQDACLVVEASEPHRHRRFRRTFLSALTAGPVRSLVLTKNVDGSHTRFHPLVIQVDGKLLKKLGEMEEFDVITSLMPPCVPGRAFHLQVMTEEQPNINARGISFPPHPCHAPF